jgi:hypothetical protein
MNAFSVRERKLANRLANTLGLPPLSVFDRKRGVRVGFRGRAPRSQPGALPSGHGAPLPLPPSPEILRRHEQKAHFATLRVRPVLASLKDIKNVVTHKIAKKAVRSIRRGGLTEQWLERHSGVVPRYPTITNPLLPSGTYDAICSSSRRPASSVKGYIPYKTRSPSAAYTITPGMADKIVNAYQLGFKFRVHFMPRSQIVFVHKEEYYHDWARSRKLMNKLQHALNGNIASASYIPSTSPDNIMNILHLINKNRLPLEILILIAQEYDSSFQITPQYIVQNRSFTEGPGQCYHRLFDTGMGHDYRFLRGAFPPNVKVWVFLERIFPFYNCVSSGGQFTCVCNECINATENYDFTISNYLVDVTNCSVHVFDPHQNLFSIRTDQGYLLSESVAESPQLVGTEWLPCSPSGATILQGSCRFSSPSLPSCYIYTNISLNRIAHDEYTLDEHDQWSISYALSSDSKVRRVSSFRLGSLHMPSSIIAGRRDDRSKLTSSVASMHSPANPHLNNSIVVPDESLFGLGEHTQDVRIGPTSVPKSIGLLNPVIRFSGRNMIWSERDRFVETIGQPNPYARDNVEVSAPTTLLSRSTHLPTVTIQFRNRQPHIKPADFLSYSGASNPLLAYFEGSENRDLLDQADSVLALDRFGADRGDRQIQAWRAQAMHRHERMITLAKESQHGQRYFTMFFHLWRYYWTNLLRVNTAEFVNGAVHIDHVFSPTMLTAKAQNADNNAFIDRPADDINNLSGNFRFTFLSGGAAPTAQNLLENPEDPLWVNNGALIREISAGRAALIDVSHFIGNGGDLDRLRLLIMALAPQAPLTSYVFNRSDLPANNQSCFNALQSIISPLPFNTDVTGVTHFVLHFGRERVPENTNVWLRTLMGYQSDFLPNPAQPDANPLIAPVPANNPYRRTYDPWVIYETIKIFATYHQAWADAWDSFDAVLYRTFHFHPTFYNAALAPPQAPAAILPSFGDSALFLPRNYTLPAYFDIFRPPAFEKDFGHELNAFTRMQFREFVATARLACHAHATSLTWAARSMSFNGAMIDAMAAQPANFNRRSRQHIYSFITRGSDDQLNAWSQVHSAATYAMYGFRPSNSTLLTTSQLLVPNYARANTTIFLSFAYHSMWAVKLLPHSYILPTPGSLPSWPANEDKPTTVPSDITGVRVARDLAPFLNVEYVQDGGMIANLQHYMSSRLTDDVSYRRNNEASLVDNFAHTTIKSWVVPSQSELPAAPQVFTPISIYPLGSAFSDYLAPIFSNFYVSDGRELALGISLNAEGVSAGHRSHIQNAWYRMTALDEANSLAISYIHPTSTQLFDPNTTLDYDFSVFYGESGEYVGLDLQPASTISLGLLSNATGAAPPPAHVTQGATIGLPVNLANKQPVPVSSKPAHPKPKPSAPASVTLKSSVSKPQPSFVKQSELPIQRGKVASLSPPLPPPRPQRTPAFVRPPRKVVDSRNTVQVVESLPPTSLPDPPAREVVPIDASTAKSPHTIGGITQRVTKGKGPVTSTSSVQIEQHNPTEEVSPPANAVSVTPAEILNLPVEAEIPVLTQPLGEGDLGAWIAGETPSKIPIPTDNSAREIQVPVLSQAEIDKLPGPVLAGTGPGQIFGPVRKFVVNPKDGFYHLAADDGNPPGFLSGEE